MVVPSWFCKVCRWVMSTTHHSIITTCGGKTTLAFRRIVLIDGRMMDFALDGVQWWSIIILDGYSRTILAGALAPSEASWATLTVLYTACARYGAPQTLISDSGGAYIAHEFEAVCTRLEIDHQTIVSTQGESSMNLMVTVER